MILFADDDYRTWMSNHIDELEFRGYVVKPAGDADEAIRLFQEHCANIDLVVLDVMLPNGKSFTPGEAELGQKTGVLLFQRFRQLKPNLAVVVLTNLRDERVKGRFRGDRRCEFRYKWDCSSKQLAEIIERLVSVDAPPAPTRSEV